MDWLDLKIVLKLGDTLLATTYLIRTKFAFKKINIGEEIAEVLFNITSGSMIDLKVWKTIGEFWNELFIEGIDDEYCLRLNTNGYRVMIDGRAKLYQQYGEQKHIKKYGVNWYPTFHSPLRLEYMYRNKILIMKRYMFKQKRYVVFQILSLLKRLLTILVAEDKRKIKIKGILQGCAEGFNKEKGKIS